MNELKEQAIQAGIMLTNTLAKNTASWVSTKIAQVKKKNEVEEIHKQYEEIINHLLEDNFELQRISMTYQSLYEQVTITDEDIEHLQRTLKRTLELFIKYDQSYEENRESLELIIELINVDTLKSMQLLGFNYNAAIGEPLTIACSNFIKNKLSVEG